MTDTRSPFWYLRDRDRHREHDPHTLMPAEDVLERYGALKAAVRTFQPCAYYVSGHDVPGAPCSWCGHTDLAHAGVHQPAMHECAVCALLIVYLEAAS